MFVVTVEFIIREESVESFRPVILRQAQNSLEREGACQQFDVSWDPLNPRRCFLYELYDDAEAFAVHVKTPHYAEFSSTVTPWIESKRVDKWELVSR